MFTVTLASLMLHGKSSDSVSLDRSEQSKRYSSHSHARLVATLKPDDSPNVIADQSTSGEERKGGGVLSPHLRFSSFIFDVDDGRLYTVAMSMSPDEIAPQACISCRKSKRKCGRELPGCALCTRLAKHCQYTETAITSSPPSQYESLEQQVKLLQAELSSFRDIVFHEHEDRSAKEASNSKLPAGPRNAFPPVFLLDTSALSNTKYTVMKIHVELPSSYYTAIGSSAARQNIINAHFEGTHTWFPIVSRKRMVMVLSGAEWTQAGDIILLVSTMKLLQQRLPQPTESLQVALYQMCKTAQSTLEAQNCFSIYTLQSAVFIALFELQHAILPAAYLSISSVARLGSALGLQLRSAMSSILPTPKLQHELEERRRLWWAIVVLDRYVHIGAKIYSLATRDPRPEDPLPMDEENFDHGEHAITRPLAIGNSASQVVSPFARLCQAGHLLGRVLRHTKDDTVPEVDFRIKEATQLHQTIKSFSVVLTAELDMGSSKALGESITIQLLPAAAICYSAQLSLYEVYTCVEVHGPEWFGAEGLAELQSSAITGMYEVCEAVLQLSRLVSTIIEAEGPCRLSPLVIDCLYQAAANYEWIRLESSDRVFDEALREVTGVLNTIGLDWQAGNEYCDILQRQEMSHSEH